MLTEALTFVDDCAEFVAVDGWLAGCCAAVFALPLAGACWAWLLAGGCCGWPVAGVAVFVCACVGWDVPVGDVGVVVCARGDVVDALGAVVVETDGVWIVVSGAFWVAGAEVVGVWVCDVVGAVVVELGDWANAAVAKTRPTAVLIRKRVFILGSSVRFLQLRFCLNERRGRTVPMTTRGNCRAVQLSCSGSYPVPSEAAVVPRLNRVPSGTFGNATGWAASERKESSQ
jgi:hypothetical protein